MRSHDVRRAVLLWAALTVIFLALGSLITRAMPASAAHDLHEQRVTMLVFTLLSAPVLAMVVAFAAYSLLAWRTGAKEPPSDEGPPVRGNTPVQVAWVTISSALVLFLLFWGFAELQTADASAAPGAMVVNVTGQQWIWSYQYPDASVESPQLVLPVDKPVVLDVTSEDVVHGFWIPNFGVKIDANPGEVTQVVVTPTQTGTFPVRCAELCGLYHAYMDSTVQVVSQSDFDAWIASGGASSGGSTTTGSTTTG
jgi:cytochrome c oxidase subunit 2